MNELLSNRDLQRQQLSMERGQLYRSDSSTRAVARRLWLEWRLRRFGGLAFNGDRIVEFTEKPQIGEGWINSGFFVLEPDVLDYIADGQTSWEREPMERLATEGQLMAYRREEFWQCMDTLRDLRLVEGLWTSGKAPWKVWEQP